MQEGGCPWVGAKKFPPPGFQGFSMLGAVWVQLAAKNQEALGNAFQKAAKYITQTCPAAGGCTGSGRGFANDSNLPPRQLEPDANRVDVDIIFGEAFKIH